MTLTFSEEQRIQNIEEQIEIINKQLRGAASKTMLNRLLVLAQKDIADATERQSTLEDKQDELIDLAQKLQ